jgi:microsomal epoxide hydrolase
LTGEIRPFRVEVPEAVLTDLRERLAHTRWPDQLPGVEWEYGTDLSYLQELCEYWRKEFDWREAERRLNAFEQFTTEVDGHNIHFVHAVSASREAVPLLLIHGWPGSVVEFLDVIAPLSETFHVVVPSLPGYGFSGPTIERGVDARRIAAMLAELMARLGYERYVAQGGDWGARIVRGLAQLDAEHLLGIHLTMFTPQPSDEAMALAEPGEAVRRHDAADLGYQRIQATRPQSLAYGLADSPAGLAGWIVEKFRLWSDCGGEIERSFTKDELLTNITLYWVTNTINSANRLYLEEGIGGVGQPYPPVTVPSAFALFPAELARPPRAWVERELNLVQWTEQPRGGHFAAMEEPELFVDDVRRFAREHLRSA